MVFASKHMESPVRNTEYSSSARVNLAARKDAILSVSFYMLAASRTASIGICSLGSNVVIRESGMFVFVFDFISMCIFVFYLSRFISFLQLPVRLN